MHGTDPATSSTRQARRHARLRSLAVALCVPSIFYGVLGTGSTLIVWALIEFNPARPDVYACLFAAAAPISFLLHLQRARDDDARASRLVAVVLNVSCMAAAAVVALTGRQAFADPFLAAVSTLLFASPLLNLAVLRHE